MEMIVSDGAVHPLIRPAMPMAVGLTWDFTIHNAQRIVLCSPINFDAYGQEIPGYRSPVWMPLSDARFRPRNDIERPTVYKSWPSWGREWFDQAIQRGNYDTAINY